MNVDLVFEGGGVKGIAFAGALEVFEEHNYQPNNLAGTSAGAIVAALVAVGYTSADIKKMMWELDFNAMKDISGVDYIPFVGKFVSLCLEKGIYEGQYIENWLQEKLLTAPHPAEYFGDLKIDLRVIASDISHGRMLTLPNDVYAYGINPDMLRIARAVRMSMSIPFFFEPIVLFDGQHNTEAYIVDGGLLSNFPVHLFDSPAPPRWPTFGLNLFECGESYNKITGPISMIQALLSTMLNARDLDSIANANYVRTINIPTYGIKATDFDLDNEQKNTLLLSGRSAAVEFLKSWNFKQYIEQYRS